MNIDEEDEKDFEIVAFTDDDDLPTEAFDFNLMSLKKEDLIQPCPTCDGRGHIYNPPIPKEVKNPESRQFIGFQSRKDCLTCAGTGEIFTEEGEAILSVIKLAKRQNLI